MRTDVAIVGMACRYPDARSPQELWENVLAMRQAFRRLPAERLRAEDYLSTDTDLPDSTYAVQGAVLTNWEFDRIGFRVVGSTYRAADPAHWLALEIAAQALADAGFSGGTELPRATTGVLLGNTLTGDYTRAQTLRLRWPYVRRQVDSLLEQENWSAAQRQQFLATLEQQYKAPFEPMSEESLAGGLSNTIAGRICNHFNLNGGGFTIDGACASSLLAVTQACNALTLGDLDIALAGGVDLSLDPFEIVGFARTQALARREMRVYEAQSAGFWPGEGCGMVVLMRYADAIAQDRRVYAVIRGWGVSSDGQGGITRPEVKGQTLALQRAYRRAEYGIGSVGYFEGHGTGTHVGDTVELEAISLARKADGNTREKARIGSVKTNIGHTKAAAGIAGLIKATLSVYHQILPPHTGYQTPSPRLTEAAAALYTTPEGGLWSSEQPLRAGVNAMGFGGINTHITLEGVASERRTAFTPAEEILLGSGQDAELLLLSAPDAADLRAKVTYLLRIAQRLSLAELTDLAALLAHQASEGPMRVALVVSTPMEFAQRLEHLHAWLAEGFTDRIDIDQGLFLGQRLSPARVGLLFPGQGSPPHFTGGLWRRRFASVRALYADRSTPAADSTATAVVQPAVVTASVAGLEIMARFGVRANLAVGHSLGELSALHWAGAFDAATLRRLAARRGAIMGELGEPTGAMYSIGAPPEAVRMLLTDDSVVIAAYNSPRQTVLSGEAGRLAQIAAEAREMGWPVIRLPVSHAFHSPLVARAAQALRGYLLEASFARLQQTVISTVTGEKLPDNADLVTVLARQVTEPVRFQEAVERAASQVDLWLEVGPGQVLSGLLHDLIRTPVLSLDAGGDSLRGLLMALGATYVMGVPIQAESLFSDRFVRPFDWNWHPVFLGSPCELAPISNASPGLAASLARQPEKTLPEEGSFKERPRDKGTPGNPEGLETLRHLVAERTELPLEAVLPAQRLLSDLHLNSITVSQLVAQAARQLGIPPPLVPTDFANVTLAQAAEALVESTRATEFIPEEGEAPAGLDSWVQAFGVINVPKPLLPAKATAGGGAWSVLAPADYPLKADLEAALNNQGGQGIVVCLPADLRPTHLGLLLEAARRLCTAASPSRFVLVQHGGIGAAFAKTLFLEARSVPTCVVHIPLEHPEAVRCIAEEAATATEFTEAFYEFGKERHVAGLRFLPTPEANGEPPLHQGDVLLVTGGGKGIGAECALALGRQTGVRLALLGRADPAEDAELAENLERLAGVGLDFRYLIADVSKAQAVREAVEQIEADLGPVTAILHSAGRNEPCALAELDMEAFARTLAPKVDGLEYLLQCIQPERLRLLVAFGSLIARTGMPGEAHYAVANEWLAHRVADWGLAHHHCRCLTLEWSVWSGAGMAERLGRVEALRRQGIMPIPIDAGLAMLKEILWSPSVAGTVVVSGRFGVSPTLPWECDEVPFLRFLEQPRVHYPGVELVADVELTGESDLYLGDHILQGEALFPAVMGLEAMTQAVQALTGPMQTLAFEQIAFLRPIAVPLSGAETMRILALRRGADTVEVALRTRSTQFQSDHFRALCRVNPPEAAGELPSALCLDTEAGEYLPLSPEKALYGSLLFHKGRFQRLKGYRLLQARRCLATLTAKDVAPWFGRYLPGALLLDDPGARDAAIHAVQACIPHRTLVPIGADSLYLALRGYDGERFVYAEEQGQEGEVFQYDITVVDDRGRLCERWKGLKLRCVGAPKRVERWSLPLLAPYWERRLAELVPGGRIAIAVCWAPGRARRSKSLQVLQHTLGRVVTLLHRPDGKPEVAGDPSTCISLAHTEECTLSIAAEWPVGCDMCDVQELALCSEQEWSDLLGAGYRGLAQQMTRVSHEESETTYTRLWAVGEALKKARGATVEALSLLFITDDGFAVFGVGPWRIVTWAGEIMETNRSCVVAFASGGKKDASL